MKYHPIHIKSSDGLFTYVVPDDGGVEIYNELGELVMYLTRSPSYVYPLLEIIATRCPDLIVPEPDFVKYRRNYVNDIPSQT